LLILLTFVLYIKPEFIFSTSSPAIETIIVLVLIALLLIPLFKEFSIFGMSFKKEVENLKSYIEKQIISLKSEKKYSKYIPWFTTYR
jgi:hypothetical protein